MKNLTLSVTDDVYRQARVRAAETGSSVSAMVTAYLRSLSAEDTEFERLAALQRRTVATIRGFSARNRLDREAVHDRALR
ncbi:MAG: DUF6364 family protein [Propionibacteriaceae bacterium]|nr:DUF6364 family protein [Propionibacteriaceae bacterium]